ncbi:acylneuraminate cytidylyltransferase family protein [Desulfovibrio mangrovi]|uniref:acylneuraminate cytidylyltransferase family protein n=1 Tax=Desulfovibrio mangrovi TaxID=2976983 RepID=UPI0022462C96|nr:acylneuraminate cytidylyltransferase family protein [Desulfovibrio mangrovi]UZP66658.1 acylneuraminate cytidylyltransferase family protein [Desulfovibrio mangrovi]
MMRKVLAVIPARGGSKGIPRKNIIDIDGKPLVAYSIEAALNAKNIDKVIVSTDDEEIAAIAKSYGAEVPFLRPPELSGDNITLAYVVLHALQWYDERGEVFDAVMSLQPTAPLISSQTLTDVVSLFHAKNAKAVTTVCKAPTHPYLAKRLLEDQEIEAFVAPPPGAVLFPRQKREPAYVINGAVYLRDRELLENLEANSYNLGSKPYAVVMSSEESVDVNEPFDLNIAAFFLQKRRSGDAGES